MISNAVSHSRPRTAVRRAREALLIAVVGAFLALPATALAGTAAVRTDPPAPDDEFSQPTDVATYLGGDEVNRVNVQRISDAVVEFRDSAGITLGRDCVYSAQGDRTRARCTATTPQNLGTPQPPILDALEVRVGNGADEVTVPALFFGGSLLDGGPGNDSLRNSAPARTNASGGRFVGGPGDDKLLGSGNPDQFLEGGRGANGRDTIVGGGGVDSVSYVGRRRRLRVDLRGDRDDGAAGERDKVGSDVEGIFGGTKRDRLTGNSRSNQINGFGGSDVIKGRGGNDMLGAGSDEESLGRTTRRTRDRIYGGRGKDELIGSSGRNVLVGGPGADSFAAGPGNDRIFARDRSRDLIGCGGGFDRVRADRRDVIDRESGRCERVRPRGLKVLR